MAVDLITLSQSEKIPDRRYLSFNSKNIEYIEKTKDNYSDSISLELMNEPMLMRDVNKTLENFKKTCANDSLIDMIQNYKPVSEKKEEKYKSFIDAECTIKVVVNDYNSIIENSKAKKVVHKLEIPVAFKSDVAKEGTGKGIIIDDLYMKVSKYFLIILLDGIIGHYWTLFFILFCPMT